jgi:hypothetical protein
MWHKAFFQPLPRILWYYAAPWLTLPLMQTFTLHRLGLDWCLSVQDSVVTNLFLGVAAMETAILFHFYQPGRDKPLFRIGFILGNAWLFTEVLSLLPGELLPDDPDYISFLEASLPVRGVVAVLVLFFISLLSWVRDRIKSQNEVELRKLESEQRLKDAELTHLRQQLHPHFLFNSLNSIHALIGRQPDLARDMTRQLSDFLRGTINKENQTLSLSEEFDHLRLYLGIEKVRFGDRLQIDMEAEPASLEIQVPALLLQPIVENAIKFGLYERTGAVQIRIRAHLLSGFLQVVVNNPFDPDSVLAREGAGFGLASVSRRLQLLYARNDLLQTKRGTEEFTTTLRIPVRS